MARMGWMGPLVLVAWMVLSVLVAPLVRKAIRVRQDWMARRGRKEKWEREARPVRRERWVLLDPSDPRVQQEPPGRLGRLEPLEPQGRKECQAHRG